MINKYLRRYIVEINEETQRMTTYQTLPEPAAAPLSCDLGAEPGKRVEAVGFLAAALELLPLSKVMPEKLEKGN
jgi:hypothetical protein